jgi:hypothetical protein
MDHKTSIGHVRWLFLLFAGSTVSACKVLASDQQSRDADAVVEHLVSFEHGVNERMMDDDLKRDLQQLRADPQLFTQAVQHVLTLSKDEMQLASLEKRLRLERALQLASLMGRDHAGALIRDFYDDIGATRTRYSERETQTPRDAIIENLRRMQWLTLRVMGEFGDTYAVDGIIRDLTRQGTDDQYAQLEYLSKVAEHRLDIRDKLEHLFTDGKSPLRNNPQLKRVLEAMDRAAAEQKKEGDDDKSRDRERKDE